MLQFHRSYFFGGHQRRPTHHSQHWKSTRPVRFRALISGFLNFMTEPQAQVTATVVFGYAWDIDMTSKQTLGYTKTYTNTAYSESTLS